MIFDAHMHITEKDVKAGLLEAMERDGVSGAICGTGPEDARWVAALVQKTASKEAGAPRLIPTYGLHPWYADRFDVAQMELFFSQCAVIGEIGMDSVWCQVPLRRQQEVFCQQLSIAQNLGKPVLLHTKGMEEEIASMLVNVTMPVILHWYSSEHHLEAYLGKDCYFTIGPDVHRNRAVQQVVEKAPLERLLVESDGLAAVAWATGKTCKPADLQAVLRSTVRCIAQIKQVEEEIVERQMEKTARALFAI